MADQPERVAQNYGSDSSTASARPRAESASAHGFPASRDRLVGRSHELVRLRELLLRPDVGLVTLTGPGGIGKTRLAQRLATDVLTEFADGAYFVSLASIRDPDLVLPAVAKALGLVLDSVRPPLDSLKQYLSDRQLLLVLDNLEQVVDVAPRLAEMIAASAESKLLVTSRVVLRVSQEHEYEVPVLGLPPSSLPRRTGADIDALGQYAAIDLFVERAQAVRTEFVLTDSNAADVLEICHRLDGLPLAIELAAARVRILPPAAIVARIFGTRRSSPLQLLSGGPRDHPTRQQTLRNTIAWSYDLLEPEEQAAFRRLAVFVSGCTIEAAGAVCRPITTSDESIPGAILDVLDSLCARSLLRQVEGDDGEPRFVMLETLREYGLESLDMAGELADTQRRHAEYFLALAELAVPELRGPAQGRWLDRLESEKDNLRAALEWSLSTPHDPQIGLRLTNALCWFWYHRSHLEEARRWLRRALAQAGDPIPELVGTLAGAGGLALIQHDLAEARVKLAEALDLARTFDDRWWVAWILHLLGRVAYFEGDSEAARSLGYQSLDLSRAIPDAWLEAWSLHLIASAAHIQGDFPLARQLFEESLDIRRRIDFREGTGVILALIGLIDFAEGDFGAARARYREALGYYRGLDAGWLMGNLVALFLALAVAVKQPDRAARLYGGLSAFSATVSIRPIPMVAAVLGPALDDARQQLGSDRFQAEVHSGAQMSLVEILAEAQAIDISSPTLMTGASGGRSGPPRPGGLTGRELETLLLIASGHTSQEIGNELVISLNTVERHITNIYRKIGARSRAEATAYALRHGLA